MQISSGFVLLKAKTTGVGKSKVWMNFSLLFKLHATKPVKNIAVYNICK